MRGELKEGTTHSVPSCQLVFRTKMDASRPLEQSRPRCDPMQTFSVDQTPLKPTTVDSNQPCHPCTEKPRPDWFLPGSRLISPRDQRGSFRLWCKQPQNGTTWQTHSEKARRDILLVSDEKCPLTISNSVRLNKEVHYVGNKGLESGP